MEYRKLNRRSGEVRLLRLTYPQHEPIDELLESSARHESEQPKLLRPEIPEHRFADAALDCTVEYVSLLEDPDYAALSYPWGSNNESEPIRINGGEISITPNLASALKCLRNIKVARIWVDRICINQEDGEEKDQQIPRMGAIYGAAKTTYAWVPVDDESYEHMQGFLEDIHRDDVQNSQPGRTELPLQEFSNNSYWRRVWVQQELALSRYVQVILGRSQFSLHKLGVYLERLRLNESEDERSELLRLLDLLKLREAIQRVVPLRLTRLLELTSECEATEPKDRVYGLWGLAADARRYLSDQSYSLSARSLCIRLTKAHLEIYKSLDIIAVLSLFPNGSENPSWTPDWFAKETWQYRVRPRQLLPCSIPALERRGYKDTVDTAEQLNPSTPWPFTGPWSAHNHTSPMIEFIGCESSVLKARGLFLGTISTYSTSHRDNGQSPCSLNPAVPSLTRRPEGLASPLQLWEALCYLFTLDNSPESPIRFKWNYYSIRDWLTYNQHFGVFDVRLADAIKRSTGAIILTSPKVLDVILLACISGFFFLVCTGAFVGCSVGPGCRTEDSTSALLALMISLAVVTIVLLIYAVSYASQTIVSDRRHRSWGDWQRCILGDETRYPLEDLRDGDSEPKHLLKLGMKLACGDFGLGWVHGQAKCGDSIVILMGCSVPLILRPRAEGGWVLVGDAIVYDAMDGQMMDEGKCDWVNIH